MLLIKGIPQPKPTGNQFECVPSKAQSKILNDGRIKHSTNLFRLNPTLTLTKYVGLKKNNPELDYNV